MTFFSDLLGKTVKNAAALALNDRKTIQFTDGLDARDESGETKVGLSAELTALTTQLKAPQVLDAELADAGSATHDVTTETDTTYWLTAVLSAYDGTTRYEETRRAIYRNVSGTLTEVRDEDVTIDGTGWTLGFSVSSTNIRATVTNSSGNAGKYSLDISWSKRAVVEAP